MLVRILWLISTVQDQSVRLEGLVRTDGLTGAPNRRTWDYEVNRATEMAREHGTSLCIAMIDLDKFKLFNDSKGHQAGDMLLRDSVAAWTAQLRPPALLARYGGEEFALLAPGFTPLQLATVLERLRQVTPHGQTFSAGVAQWDPSTDPGRAVAAADEALYAAKRAGRDRVVIAGDEPPAGPPTGPISFTSITVKADPIKPFDESGPPVTSRRGRRRVHRMPSFEMVTQPIVDLRVHQVCAHEALARFDALGTSLPTSEVFRQAYREGFGDLLELAAIQAALDLPGRPPGHDLYVNASARALMTARMRTGLPDNLSGITIELSEDPGDIDMNDLVRVINDLRDRGAGIALDDVGAGAQEFARLAMLQPDMVKIDRTLVVGCAVDPGRTAVVRGLVVYAEMMGSLICAEGAETAADLDHLAALGVTHAQGNLLAEPKKGWQTLTPPPAFDFAPDPPISFAPATSFEPGTTFGPSNTFSPSNTFGSSTPYEPASTLDPSDPLDPSTPLEPETSWTFRPPGYDDPDATSPMVIRRDPEE
nr:bifunctional diguanylate cyclase/phosphodiesterase [Kineosporia mesophila]